jgi:branched-chain amino acid aminotransferase
METVVITSDESSPPFTGCLQDLNSAAKLSRHQGGCDVKRYSRRDNLTSKHPAATITVNEVASVVRLDGRPIGDGNPGPVTNDLLSRFQKLTRE